MVTLGRILFTTYIVLLLLATVILVGSIAALTGESYMIMSAIVTLLLWLVLAGMTIKAMWFAIGMARDQSDKLDDGLFWAKSTFVLLTILSQLTGLALAFGAFAACGPLWVANLFHWAGFGGTILGFVTFFSLPLVKDACGVSSDRVSRHHWLWLIWPVLVGLTWGLAWLIPYVELKGDIDENLARTSGYKLPFPLGESSWVIQGNNSGGGNHNGDQKFAWDFRRRCGSPVLAARGGTIVDDPGKTRDSYTGNGSDKPNNFITIRHDDNTLGRYFHIQQYSIVRRSGTVRQGEEIAKVGNVGNSLTGHIHFVVEDSNGHSLPVKFQDADVEDDKGIPRTFCSYTSDNRKVP